MVSTIATTLRRRLEFEIAVEKTLRLENAARFPLSHRTTATGTLSLFRVCKKNNGMKQQSNGVPENLSWRLVEKTEAIYQDRHARIIIMRPEH